MNLPHRVTIETRTEVSDGHKGFTETWAVTKRRISALVKPLAGRDLDRARQIDPRTSHAVSLRRWAGYLDDTVGGRTRVVWHDRDEEDRTLEIVEPFREVVDGRFIEATCREAA